MASDSPIRLMVVDDTADVRFLVRATMDDAGQGIEIVAEVDGGRTALERLDSADPDVVLLDARMPLMDGYELAAAILEARPGQPLVLLTSVVDDEIRARARAAGISECVEKGRFDDLPEIVRRAAGRG